MHRVLAAVFSLLVTWSAPLAGQIGAGPAYTITNVRLREAPDVSAPILATLPRASRVQVGACDQLWCELTYAGRAGYAAVRYLEAVVPARVQRVIESGRGYRNAAGDWVRSPILSPSGPPAGASARCRDGTYSFSASRRGTCSHHGGVSTWL